MKLKLSTTLFTISLIGLFMSSASAQNSNFAYAPSQKHPFGLPNPNAPEQIKDYAPIIGTCDCKSTLRNQDGTWAEAIDMQWTFKYIMNGMAVQDETLKADGSNSGSIRQFIPAENKWYVHYFSSAGPTKTLPVWEGSLKDGEMMLYKDQKAPNGIDGFYKIRFSEMNGSGFKWIGAWVSKDESVVYETWKIDCEKRK